MAMIEPVFAGFELLLISDIHHLMPLTPAGHFSPPASTAATDVYHMWQELKATMYRAGMCCIQIGL